MPEPEQQPVTRPCQFCDGTGKRRIDDRACWHCDGRGTMPVENPNGLGYCPACGKRIQNLQEFGDEGVQSINCPHCEAQLWLTIETIFSLEKEAESDDDDC